MFIDSAYHGYLMVLAFALGYLFIVIEHGVRINKAATAMLMAILCWVIQFSSTQTSLEENKGYLSHHLAMVSEIVFFLMGALAIVETISVHHGFRIVTEFIRVSSKRRMLWIVAFITFFLSSILDNLTTTIVMITLTRKLVRDRHDLLVMGCAIVVAANAGGAWTPIGDITTTMLWIDGQVSTMPTIQSLFLPSIVCLMVSVAWFTFMVHGNFDQEPVYMHQAVEPKGKLILLLGIACLIFVPIFKTLTGLPPYMGMLFGLSVLWFVTDFLHSPFEERNHLRLPAVLSNIDVSSILFFLGILLSIAALDTFGLLDAAARALDAWLPVGPALALVIGFLSAVIDNVPLVAAAMGMYDLADHPPDSPFWQMLAYTAGTGGSMLIIGSAAGVAFMALENVSFLWYLRYATIPALFGYLAGFGVYLLLI